jgi:DNA polymerase I-like protein with 3'-5' exonuclease and polymerase domains
LHQRTAEDAKVKRNPLAKNANFGLLYRMGAPKFCIYADLFDSDGLPMIEFAKKLIAGWHEAYPDIAIFHEAVEFNLIHSGWIAKTLFGRRRRLDQEARINRFRAVTQGIQFMVSGTAQDIMKTSMVQIWDAREQKIANARPAEKRLWQKVKFLMQIHDEIIMQGPIQLKAEITQMIKEGMESVGRGFLRIPLTADVKCGINWDHVH